MPYSIILDPHDLIETADLIDAQLPFATAKALNELATTFQSGEQQTIGQHMTIRRPWVLQGVKIDRNDFATKQKLSVRVHIDDQRDFLDKFEDGGTRRPVGAGLSLAVPVNVRRTKSQLIARTQTPKAFQFVQGYASVKSRWTVLKGNRHTFLLQRPDGSGLILQRTNHPQLGPSRYGSRNLTHRRWGHDPNLTILWNLRPSTPVPKLLDWRKTANSALSAWPGTFKKWYLEALRTAR